MSKLREIREAKGITQKELAEEVGVTDAYICRIERGTTDPRLSVVEDIARVLGVSVAQLTDGVPD